MEYADNGTLQDYLKEHFKSLTWNNKFDFAVQLACGISRLHNEEIVHCDLVIYCLIFMNIINITI
jgi:serine/threonine protein kinase